MNGRAKKSPRKQHDPERKKFYAGTERTPGLPSLDSWAACPHGEPLRPQATPPDWAQIAAREICDSFPPEQPRMQSEFMASIIRKHAAPSELVGALRGCVTALRQELAAAGPDEVKQHPVLREHAKALAAAEKALKEKP